MKNQLKSQQRKVATLGESLEGDNYLDVLGMVQRNLRLIMAGFVIGAVAGAIFFLNTKPIYESTAALFVEEPVIETLSTDTRRPGDAGTSALVGKYVEVLQSDRILGPAVETCGLETLQSLDEVEDKDFINDFVREHLYVWPSDKKSESGVIAISMRSTQSSDAKRLLTSIIEVFQEFVAEAAHKVGGQNLETMKQFQEKNTAEIAATEAEIDKLMLMPHIREEDGKVVNQYEMQVEQIQEEMQLNESDVVKLESLLVQLKHANVQDASIEDLVIESFGQIDRNQLQPYAETQQEYIRLSMLEQELLSDYGDQHPELRNVRKQIDLLKKMRRRHLLSAFGKTPVGDEGDIDFYQAAVEHINTKLVLLRAHQNQLGAAMTDAKKKSLAIKKDCDRLATLLGQLKGLRENSVKMKDYAIELGVLQDAKHREVELINFPSKAVRVFPKLKYCVPVGAILGMALGFGIGFLKELSEQTFRSSREITSQLGLPVLGELGRFGNRRLRANEFSKVGGEVVALHQPLSPAAETFKSIRTWILFESSDRSAKVIQITSPSPGDGKSTVAANLAASIVQVGRSVILLDCDLRKPTQQKYFSLDPEKPGMTAILTGQADWTDAVQDVGVENLSVIGCGNRYSNPSEMLTGTQLPELLGKLRRKYDFVILDTPPVLPVTDSRILSNYVDMIFLAICIRKGVQSAAAKTVAELGSVREKIQGVIANVMSKKEARGYDSGYGAKSTYGSNRYDRNEVYGSAKGLTEATLAKPARATHNGTRVPVIIDR